MVSIGLIVLALPVPGWQAPSPEVWDRTVERGIESLRKSQASDGSWSAQASPGITGIVVTGLLRTKKVSPEDPMIQKGLAFIENQINPTEGHIAGKGPRVRMQNYVTCVNLMALTEAGKESYRPVIKDAAKFLRQLQWDEGEGRDPGNPSYGGAGYEPNSRPDLSNTQTLLDALVDAGIPRNDPAFGKALAFVSRCQNLSSENNTLPLAGKINDGSFVYTPLSAEASKTGEGVPGYASMTYAGIKSMIYCGVDAKDPRIIKALEWIRAHYDLDRHPGMPKGQETMGLFYYYHTLANCLDTMGLETIKDAKGVEHPWRSELTEKLARLQKPDGSWANTHRGLMENNPDLATGFALMALSHTKGRTKTR